MSNLDLFVILFAIVENEIKKYLTELGV